MKVTKPTKAQLQHDAYLVITTFIAAFLTTWQVQPDRFSKAAVLAAVGASIAAVVTLLKSTLTSF